MEGRFAERPEVDVGVADTAEQEHLPVVFGFHVLELIVVRGPEGAGLLFHADLGGCVDEVVVTGLPRALLAFLQILEFEAGELLQSNPEGRTATHLYEVQDTGGSTVGFVALERGHCLAFAGW